MNQVDRELFTRILDELNIRRGDRLLVHSAIQFLGKPVGGPEMYLSALLDRVGPDGTIATPAFNFRFTEGDPFNPDQTPSSGMGVFAETIRTHPYAKRSIHPLQSVSVIGDSAESIAALDTPSAFDNGSAFERILDLDFKVFLLGAGIDAVSLLHYSEQHNTVPYRYWKDFSGQVKKESSWETCTYRMYVRNMEIDPKLSLAEVRNYLMENGQWHSATLNYGEVSICMAVDFIAAVDHFLQNDPWSLLTNKPDKLKNLD